MATIEIDNKYYDLGIMSDECKGQLGSLQFVGQELVCLQAKYALLQTAKSTKPKI